MDRLLIALPLVLAAVAVAFVVQRRAPDAPAQPVNHVAPEQLDRADFAHLGGDRAPWLVVAFTSATCDTCPGVAAKAAVLGSPEVDSIEVEYSAERALHERYSITAVPTVVIADRDGVVRRSFLGSTSATHLWAALADLREPGSVPPGCEGNH